MTQRISQTHQFVIVFLQLCDPLDQAVVALLQLVDLLVSSGLY